MSSRSAAGAASSTRGARRRVPSAWHARRHGAAPARALARRPCPRDHAATCDSFRVPSRSWRMPPGDVTARRRRRAAACAARQDTRPPAQETRETQLSVGRSRTGAQARSRPAPASAVGRVSNGSGSAGVLAARSCGSAAPQAGTQGERAHDEHQEARARDRVGGARGAEGDDRAAEQEPDAGHGGAERLHQSGDPRLVVATPSAPERGHHGDPLDAVADAADDRDQARREQRPRDRHPEVGDPDRRASRRRRAPSAERFLTRR